MRIHTGYVCPSKADIVDETLTSIQDRGDWFDEARETPERLRTAEQQEMVHAVGCS